MRILLTNDDGIDAPGLTILEEIAKALSDDIWIVAPASDQSGVSHSLTLHDPLRVVTYDDRRMAVRGTPTDCVIMAYRTLMDQPPDLILSGVNFGQNMAEHVTYSGTIAAAMEGTLLGVRSIALSQTFSFRDGDKINWEPARVHGAPLIKKLLDLEFAPGTLLNVNFPDCPPDQVNGYKATVHGHRNQSSMGIDERSDGRGRAYYWLAFKGKSTELIPETDLAAVANKSVSVTPLSLDLTDHETHLRLKSDIGLD